VSVGRGPLGSDLDMHITTEQWYQAFWFTSLACMHEQHDDLMSCLLAAGAGWWKASTTCSRLPVVSTLLHHNRHHDPHPES
jgi:hypothetical protein